MLDGCSHIVFMRARVLLDDVCKTQDLFLEYIRHTLLVQSLTAGHTVKVLS